MILRENINIPLSDFEVVELIRKGDKSALRLIINRFEAKIAGTVYGMLGNTQEADDVCQEVFIRFYRSINNFRGDSALGTYLTRIAINLSLNELKKRRTRIFFEFGSAEREINAEFGQKNVSEKVENTELVQKALLELDPKFRSVVVLRLIDEYSTEETAQILNLPLGTVLSRLSRGQKKLKKILTPFLEGE